MPSWNEVLKELHSCRRIDSLDYIRAKYLNLLHEKENRNIICYYSGWLQKPNSNLCIIDDNDKNSLMAVIHKMDSEKGLDLFLHTPGGDIAATESIVSYLKQVFSDNIRAIVPQIAMSGGTMIACCAKEIIMGKQSNLGPIDPQFGNLAAQAILDEFEQACREIKEDKTRLPMWQLIIQKHPPTMLGQCKRVIEWSESLVSEWLKDNMLKNDHDQVEKVLKYISSHSATKAHSRHIHIDKCKEIGLKIIKMEDDDKLQDLILTIHHCYMHTFQNSKVAKIVENHMGVGIITNLG